MKTEDIFDKLYNIALINPPVANAKVASCITYKNNIISYGYNSLKTHPFQRKYSKNSDCIHLHAEVDAIKNALRCQNDLSKCSIYICRVRKEDRDKPFVTGLSRPCLGCMRAIAAFNIKNVFYTTFKCEEFTAL